MIAFTVSLTERDWDQTRSGWRCSVLKIPGAQVDGLYSGSKVDDAWYKIDAQQEVIFWAHGKEPSEAALAVRLTQDLEPKELSVFWKKLSIMVPIAVALVTGGIAWITRQASAPPSAGGSAAKTEGVASRPGGSYYETWSLTGQVTVDKGKFQHYQVASMIRPPHLTVMDDGYFREDIPVKNRGNGDREFPSITFDSQVPGYDRPVIHLGPSTKKSTYVQDIDEKQRIIAIRDPITFSKPPAYSAKAAALEQKGAPGPKK